MVLFLGTFLLVVGSLHYYFWARLVRDTGLPGPWRTVGTIALAVLGLSLPLVMILRRRVPGDAARLLVWPAYVWLGLMMFLFLFLLGGDLVRVGSRLAGFDPERRQMLHRILGGGAAALTAGFGLLATRNALGAVAVTRLTIPLSRLPRALDETTIVQLTDLHIGPTIGRAWLEDVVARTNALAPDIVAITGDLVDGSVADLRDLVAPLAALKAKYGVFFVTGNHEYYSGATEWEAELSRLGVRVLRNERVVIGEGEHAFDLAGIDDYNARGFAPGHGPDLARALAGRDPTRELVLMAHQPRAIHEAAEQGVGLQLSGHTHGGQIFPWNFMVRLQQPYVAGLSRKSQTWIYVSRGTGYWGPPMRLGADAEITHITLRAAPATV